MMIGSSPRLCIYGKCESIGMLIPVKANYFESKHGCCHASYTVAAFVLACGEGSTTILFHG